MAQLAFLPCLCIAVYHGPLVLDACLGDRQVLRVDFAADKLEAFAHGCLFRSVAAHEMVERGTAW